MLVKEIIQDSIWMPGLNYGKAPVELSILLPTYRRFECGLFEKCVNSLLAQTFCNFEIIIIDDCSIDGTFDRIKRYMQEDGRVSCIRHQRNIGLPAISEYEGYCRANGIYIGYAFDDCVFKADAYEKLFYEVKRLNAKVVFGYASATNSAGFKELFGKVDDANDLAALRLNNFIPNCGFLIHRDVLETVGHYDPHISLIRLCDWDFWIRIYKQYDIVPVDVYVAHEGGTILRDSLGNSFELNFQAVFAQIYRDRSELLSTKNFPEYEVIDPPHGLCIEAFDAFKGLVERDFRKRFWCVPTPTSEGDIEAKSEGALVTCFIDACTSLYFDGLEKDMAEKLYYMSPAIHYNTPECIATCGYVIISRDLNNRDIFNTATAAIKMGTPTYYYTDDNFPVLAEEGRWDKYFLSEEFRRVLREFDGVIVTTPALVEYFTSMKLHENCLLMPPIYRLDIPLPENRVKAAPGTITVAFQGGTHRSKPFLQIIYPAIKRLAKNYRIRLVCPDFIAKTIEPAHNVELISLPFRVDYVKFIQLFRMYEPDLVLHANDRSANNKYKSVNALLNATLMGACLVASKDDPYTGLPENVVTLAENAIEEWEARIRMIIEKPEYRKAQLVAADKYCREHYNAAINSKILREISFKHAAPNAFEVRLRMRRMLIHSLHQTETLATELGFRMTLHAIAKLARHLMHLVKMRGMKHYLKKARDIVTC
ncbi:glycosyltransferase [Desulfocurvibacter africanus]|uniref:Glycosyl transferase family 2 n=1 Tax=Desulfocurvibacter africanus subsp. africanus str. Walvis Bay TaxID=690850 RepID=F3YWI0_DESAF|nr:glycosyltransferase [Desulfocurvibacter africanus]EGJ49366.1 glycosyl transferase family 2 [Desulfocurvibacter africanus subsp. africanus str. Walvis Bay]